MEGISLSLSVVRTFFLVFFLAFCKSNPQAGSEETNKEKPVRVLHSFQFQINAFAFDAIPASKTPDKESKYRRFFACSFLKIRFLPLLVSQVPAFFITDLCGVFMSIKR